jgi:DNA-binding PadR family transcriptional regulator
VNTVASKKLQTNLEKLGVDMGSSEMQVFQAVLMAAGSTEKPVNYHEIATCLEAIANRKYTKAYIYRRLNSLEEDGFIIADTIHSPRTYSITESSVTKALDSRRKEKLSENLTRKQDLTTRIHRLKSIKSQDLALMLHKQLAGVSGIDDSLLIEGVENVRSTIIREFADGANEGDVVRVLGHTSTLAEGLGPGGVTELRVMQAGLRGVKVLGLLTPVGQDTSDVELLAKHLVPLADVFEKAASTGNIQLKISREPINTYRIVSLNEDKMLLYLTHAKESDVAALVQRKDNPGLLDDALRTFDEIWESSIDVLEIVAQIAKKEHTA